MKKVGMIGHFGGNNLFYDGQTIKTKELFSLLETSGKFQLQKVDTYLFKTNKFMLLLHTLWCLLFCNDIFLLVADRGLRFYLPFLYYFRKLKQIRVYHCVIGSELLEMVEQTPRFVRYLNSFKANWFEFESGTQFLKHMGVTNVSTLPNFKRLTPIESVHYAFDGKYRFCTFSRVMEEKGITAAINAIKEINQMNGYNSATLDIYGPVDISYKPCFDRLLMENKDYVTYKGIANSHKSVEILKDYYALLFPTCWRGEGTPGTIIDAYASGLPIIATDWRANKEMIKQGTTGILYPSDVHTTLTEAIQWAMDHQEQMQLMRVECRTAFDMYRPEKILDTIMKCISGIQ